MHYFDRWVTRISTAMAVVAAVLLLAATLIITMMVIKRSIGLQNSWELELSIELMVGAIFLASPYTLATGGHVKMDLLDALLPASLKHYLTFVAGLIGCLVCLYLGWKGLQMTQHAFVTGERVLGIWRPLAWPKYATIPAGMLMTALQYVTSMHREYCARRENVCRENTHQEISTCQN